MNKFFVVLLSILFSLCIALDVWYVILYFNNPEKVSSQTYEVGAQTVTTIDGNEDTRYFCELNYYDDCFEIKFNYMLDENANSFYSQGLQLVPKNNKFDFSGNYDIRKNGYKYEGYSVFEKKSYREQEWFLFAHANYIHTYYDMVVTGKQYDNLSIYNYASMDNYETVINDPNEITLNSAFKIEMGNDIYLMKFNADKAVKNKDSAEMQKFLIQENFQSIYVDDHTLLAYANNYIDYYNIYRASDITYFIELLFNSIQSLRKGTEQTIVFQFGDLFDYYAFDKSSGTYLETTISSDKYAKVIADIKSYYAIKVNIHDGNINSAKNSIFKAYKGSMNYTTEELVVSDYFNGKTLLIVSDLDFTIIQNSEANILKLSDTFINSNKKFINNVELKVILSDDFLENTNAVINSSSFDEFSVYKVITSSGREIAYE